MVCACVCDGVCAGVSARVCALVQVNEAKRSKEGHSDQ